MEFMMRIREKTSLLHAAAEHSGYIKRLVEGDATVEGYGEYLYNLHAVYEAIEDNEALKDFVTPELYRTSQVLQDVAYILNDKKESLSYLASTAACVSRIHEVAEKNPILVAAYAYTRFLADLFGGRTFPELLKTKYNLSEEGMHYYRYEELGDVKSYVMKYHSKLAGIRLSEQGKENFLTEINNAYIYNIAISNELEMKLHKK